MTKRKARKLIRQAIARKVGRKRNWPLDFGQMFALVVGLAVVVPMITLVVGVLFFHV